MTTWFVDFENGTDATASTGNGDSFATRRKYITNVGSGALDPGDTIKVMGTPAPVSLGNGDWVGQTANPARQSITSSTNATPIVVTSTSHGLLTGDFVVISNHNTNTNANGWWQITKITDNTFSLDNSVGNGTGSGGYFRKVWSAIDLTYSPCVEISSCSSKETVWTASTNVTCDYYTSTYYMSALDLDCLRVQVGTSFTTGKAAYKTISSTDLSGYQQLSFFFIQYAGTTLQASDLSLNLCSDTTGDTVVNSFNLPANTLGNYKVHTFTIDLATALGSSIQSIALYVNVDRGAATFFFSHILACKDADDTDCLTLTHLIGKNTTNEPWYRIRGIRGSLVWLYTYTLTNDTLYQPTNYYGTTETATAYSYKPILVERTEIIGTVQDDGSSGSPITISGGWDRTDMSTQTLETFVGYFGQYTSTYGLYMSSRSYINVENMSFLGFYYALFMVNCDNITVNVNNIINAQYACYLATWENMDITAKTFVNNYYSTQATNNYYGLLTLNINKILASANTSDATILGSGYINVNIDTIANETGSGLKNTAQSIINITTIKYCNEGITDSASAKYTIGTISYCVLGFEQIALTTSQLINTVFSNNTTDLDDIYNLWGTNIDFTTYNLYNKNAESLHIDKYLQTNNAFTATYFGEMQTSTAVRHTASGLSWKFQATTSTNEHNMLEMQIAKIAIGASETATVSLWVYKTTTNLTGRLICRKNQLAGLTSDIYDDTTSGTINEWQQIEIEVTPTEAGVVEIFFGVFGDTSATYIDDISVS